MTFEPFVGVGPSRYLDVFQMPQRKDHETGDIIAFDPSTATPRIEEIEDPEMLAELQPYVRRERRAFEVLDRVQQQDGAPRFTAEEGEDGGSR